MEEEGSLSSPGFFARRRSSLPCFLWIKKGESRAFLRFFLRLFFSAKNEVEWGNIGLYDGGLFRCDKPVRDTVATYAPVPLHSIALGIPII